MQEKQDKVGRRNLSGTEENRSITWTFYKYALLIWTEIESNNQSIWIAK